jgi:hypothetical protein
VDRIKEALGTATGCAVVGKAGVGAVSLPLRDGLLSSS